MPICAVATGVFFGAMGRLGRLEKLRIFLKDIGLYESSSALSSYQVESPYLVDLRCSKSTVTRVSRGNDKCQT